VGGKVDYSTSAEDLVDQLDVLVIERSVPKALRMDNGPEIISKALRERTIEVPKTWGSSL
jgi:hypothetical protein